MKIFKRYISFSKALVFALCTAFFLILGFDAYVIIRLMDFVEAGVSMTYTTVLGTITGTMSTFSNAVILFAVKHYLEKAQAEHAAGYDARTQTTSAERMHMANIENGKDVDD